MRATLIVAAGVGGLFLDIFFNKSGLDRKTGRDVTRRCERRAKVVTPTPGLHGSRTRRCYPDERFAL